MANALRALIELPEAEQKEKGVESTPQEIYQQPEMWRQTLEIMKNKKDEIIKYLGNETDRQIILSGAGTSEFIGLSLVDLFNKASGYDTKSIATTSIITDPDSAFQVGRKYFLVHFARSGNSPESVGTFTLGEESKADIKHIVITCNKDGKLAQMAKTIDSLMILLPEKTNDRSLAMTSSFSSMVVAGQCLATIKNIDTTAKIVEKVAQAGQSLMDKYSDDMNAVCQEDFTRAVFLGSNTLKGCATECHLKLQEETSGRVVAKFDSFLGLRHGPEAVIDDKTVVIYLLGEDPFIRKYEMDLIAGVKGKGIGMKKIAVSKKADSELRSLCDLVFEHGIEGIPDDYLTPAYVTVGQELGVFKSLSYGLKPDSPSEAGVISRVVKGVKIYDRPLYQAKKEFRVIAG
ncbi:MAG: SIS domain-containing protein [Planctomycetota bacterium]|jgi:tagatose-6-phosphate ketose/aldose isomerase